MGRRIVIILVIILISALVVMGYLLAAGKKNLLTDPYKVIPPDACIVIETIDIKSFLNSLTTGRGLFGEAGNIPEMVGFNRKLKYLADQLNKENFKELFPEGSAIMSFHTGKEGSIIPLLSMPVESDIKIRHLKEMLGSSGIRNVTETRVSGKAVLVIPFAAENTTDTGV